MLEPMSDSELIPTRPRPAAPWIACGLPALLLGPLLYAVGLAKSEDYEYSADPGQPWMIAGGLAVIVGAVLLSVGVFYLVQHADRAAGVRYPANQLKSR